MNKKKKLFSIISVLLFFVSCSNGMISCAENKNTFDPDKQRKPDGDFGQSVEIIDDGSTTNYVDSTTAPAAAVVTADLYQNFTAEGTVEITFNGTTWTTNFSGAATSSNVTINSVENSTENETSRGVEIQYKGDAKLKYILSGTYTGTVFIKNKKADAAVVLNGINITSDNGAGPVLRFSSEKRTFIVTAPGTTNTLTDTRILNQSSTMYDDKKGSVYSKGTLIFTGDNSTANSAGTLNIINKGYKHAVYTKDYVRIANGINLNITVDGTTGRDCIRSLTAAIIDGGNINLTAKGTLEDDESNGIRVDGEDADEDDMTVEYTAGAGFVIINGGNLTINTVAKGVTAHWKSAKSVIGNSSYTATANKSLLYSTYLSGTTATTPNPFVEINGGNINIKTTGEPYEGQTDDDPSCSPEGIEAKANFTINAGTITVQTTDDAINAGGNFVMNGGALYACSSRNDAIDANGSNGITINGGVVVAIGLAMPECGFDCDNNPFTINGGTVVGLGTSMYTAPKSGAQSAGVLASSNYGSANKTTAIVDSNGKPVFVYTLPSAIGEVMILSAPSLKTGTTYTVKTGVTVKDGTGTRFHNLYTTMPTISGGSSTITDFATSSSNMVYTDSKAGSGFGNFGGGPGGPGGFGGRQAFGNGEMPEPPEGFKGGRPDGNFQPPEGFEPSEGMEPPEGFKGGRPNGNFQPSEGMEPPEGFNKKQRGNKKQQNKQ